MAMSSPTFPRTTRTIRAIFSFFEHRPGMAGICGGIIALLGQTAFTSTFTDFKSAVLERVTFPMIIAEIDSYRAYSDSVKCSPQISNTIASLNARIEHEHESNRHGYSDPFTSDRWDSVQPIPLYCGGEHADQP